MIHQKCFRLTAFAFLIGALSGCTSSTTPSKQETPEIDVDCEVSKHGLCFQTSLKRAEKNDVLKPRVGFTDYQLGLDYQNTTKDTIYYLSYTCLGDANLIRTGDKNVELADRLLCNYTGAEVHKIAPQEHLTTGAYFSVPKGTKKMMYSFYFKKVNRSFNIDNLRLDDKAFDELGSYITFEEDLTKVPEL